MNNKKKQTKKKIYFKKGAPQKKNKGTRKMRGGKIESRLFVEFFQENERGMKHGESIIWVNISRQQIALMKSNS